MANNNFFQILLEAILDENASASKIKQQVDNLSKKAGTLKLGTSLDEKEIQRLRSEISQIQKELANENLTTKQRSALLTELNQKQRTLNAESRAYNQQEKADLANQRNALSQIAAAQKDVVSIKRSQSQLNKMEKAEEEQINATIRERTSLLSTMKTWHSKQSSATLSKTGAFGSETGEIRTAQVAYEQLFAQLEAGTMSIEDARLRFQLLKDGIVQSANTASTSIKSITASIQENGTTATTIDILRNNFSKLGLTTEQVRQKMSLVDSELATLRSLMNSGDNAAIEAQFARLNDALFQTQNNLKKTRSDYSLLATEQQRLTLANTMESWLSKNSRITGSAKSDIQAYITSLRELNSQMTKMQFEQMSTGFKKIQNSMSMLGKLGASLKSHLMQAAEAFTYYFSARLIVMKFMQTIMQMPSKIKELDTALVDLKKTAQMSASQLENFYYTANETAKQMGVTTKEIIDQAAAWSRLGYSSAEAATKMAKYSSMFASISPGMDVDKATDGLVSIMKAFDIGNDNPDEVLDGIMSKINIIGNTAATSNDEIVTMLSKSSSAMREANNTLEETIALETAAVEITRDDDSVGTAFKTVAMRIRGYDEETESFSNNVEQLSGDIANLTKTASTPGGISLFTDASKTEYKSTYQLLKEISEIYDQLDDKTQAGLLEALAGKRQGQIIAATINNFEAAEKAMDNMANSAGSAEKEMAIIMDSVDYKANKLAETGTGIAQNLFQRDDMKVVLDVLTDLAEALDWVTEKAGLFGTIALGGGLFAGIKNFGRPKMFGLKSLMF